MKHNLDRFVQAQSGTYIAALSEISRGKKSSHWMWFVFPQLAGLGKSEIAQHYAISSLDEARAYLDHPVLGGHYLECVTALQDLAISDPKAVLGSVDAIKLHSSLTLFAEAAPQQQLFAAALNRWFGGIRDKLTLEFLR